MIRVSFQQDKGIKGFVKFLGCSWLLHIGQGRSTDNWGEWKGERRSSALPFQPEGTGGNHVELLLDMQMWVRDMATAGRDVKVIV